MGAPCPFHNCAIKKRGVEFCGFCPENATCIRWKNFRESAKRLDSIVCYQRLEDNIAVILQNGPDKFEEKQRVRENLLRHILAEFNEGRSKTLYCIAATLLEIDELENVLKRAREKSSGFDSDKKAEVMHSLLNEIAEKKHYFLKLRK